LIRIEMPSSLHLLFGTSSEKIIKGLQIFTQVHYADYSETASLRPARRPAGRLQ
jgi:hypothetical protein